MRKPIAFLGVLTAIAAATIALTASGASATAGGSMTAGGMPSDHMSYLIGTWNCTVTLAGMMGKPATTDHGTLTFSMGPHETIHAHVAATDYAQDAYYGYDPKTKTHWTTAADTEGVIASETSKDGVTFTGTSIGGGMSTPTRDTLTHPSARAIRDLTEIETNGKWTTLADSHCTKP